MLCYFACLIEAIVEHNLRGCVGQQMASILKVKHLVKILTSGPGR